MIEYEIIVNHKRDTPPSRKAVAPGDPDYKTTVLQRTIKRYNFKRGDLVKIRRGHKRGVIDAIELDCDKVLWEDNKPMCILVNFNEEFIWCHPSQLKRRNK